MREETLSDKIRSECHGDCRCFCDVHRVINEEDVKEFIKKLKEELSGDWIYDRYELGEGTALKAFIDKLAGDKLI
jgi:hypothetical protein